MAKIYKNIVFSFVLLLCQWSVFGQLEHSKRLEFDHNLNDEEEYQVIPLGKNGLFLINSKINYIRRNLTLNFVKYDTTFTENWHASYSPDDRFELIRTFTNGRFLYLFFREESAVRINILRIDFENGDKSFVEGILPVNMDIDFFSILKSKAFIGGKYNDRPVVVSFNLFDGMMKVLPDLHANQLIINELDVNETTENTYVMLKNERTCQFILKIYNYDGRLLSSTVLGERSHNPISGKILNLSEEKSLLIGNFSESCMQLSEGIYLHNLEQNKIQFVKFTDLKNFFKYLKPKREQKIIAKINSKKVQGKELKLKYRLLLHDFIPYQEGFLLIAEIFYPEYKPPQNTIFNSMRTYHIGGDVYNNFRYTHAIICYFDKNGKLIWDNCFPLDGLESSELNEKTQLTMSDDLFILGYPKEGIIKTEVIRGDQNVKSIEKFQIKTDSDSDKITNSEKTNLSAWYDRNFIVYGYQSIRNNKNPSIIREVFFINKLNYLPK